MSQSIGSSIGYSRKRLKRLKRPSLGLKRPILITKVTDITHSVLVRISGLIRDPDPGVRRIAAKM